MGEFSPSNYAHWERVEESNPVPIQLVLEYLDRARQCATSDKELRALRNAESIVMRSATREDTQLAIFGKPTEWEDDPPPPLPDHLAADRAVRVPPAPKDMRASFRREYEQRALPRALRRKEEAIGKFYADEKRRGWRELINFEIRAALCQGAKRYKEPVANLRKDARILIAAIAGYIGSAVGFQAAIVAALVASVAHLIFRLGKEVFCASFVEAPSRRRVKA